MEVKLSKWGNSYGIRIPKKLLNSINVSVENLKKENVKLEAIVEGRNLILRKNNSPLEELFKNFKGDSNNYKADIDYGCPVGNEIW